MIQDVHDNLILMHILVAQLLAWPTRWFAIGALLYAKFQYFMGCISTKYSIQFGPPADVQSRHGYVKVVRFRFWVL